MLRRLLTSGFTAAPALLVVDPVQVGNFPAEELPHIIRMREVKLLPGVPKLMAGDGQLSPATAEQIGRVYYELMGTASSITMREVVKWIRRTQALNVSVKLAGWSLLSARLTPGSGDYQALQDVFTRVWPTAEPLTGEARIENRSHTDSSGSTHVTGVRFREGGVCVDVAGASLERSALFRGAWAPLASGLLSTSVALTRHCASWNAGGAEPPQSFVRCLVRVAVAAHCREPVLLVGPTACKSTVIQEWARITGRNQHVKTVHLTPDTDTPELVGQMQPYTLMSVLRQLVTFARAALDRSMALDVARPSQRDEADPLDTKALAALYHDADEAVTR